MFIYGRKGREKHLIFTRCRFDNLWMEWTCILYKRGIVSMSSVYLLSCSFFFFSSSSFLLHFSYFGKCSLCNYSLYKVCKLKIQENICVRACVHIYVYIMRIHIHICMYNIHIYAHMHRYLYIYLCLFHLFLMLGSQRNFHNCHLFFLWKFRNSQILKWKADNFSIFRFTPIHFFEFHNSFLQESTKIM